MNFVKKTCLSAGLPRVDKSPRTVEVDRVCLLHHRDLPTGHELNENFNCWTFEGAWNEKGRE